MALCGLLGWRQLLGVCVVRGWDMSVGGQESLGSGVHLGQSEHIDCLPAGDGKK